MEKMTDGTCSILNDDCPEKNITDCRYCQLHSVVEDYRDRAYRMQEEKMESRYLCRGKRIDNGEWVEGYYFPRPNDPGGDKYYIVTVRQCKWIEINPSTICKCTGLRDKNRKLIWEKDIVDGHIKRGAAFQNCVVLWNECKARFDVRAMDCNFPMTLDEVTDDISICGLDYEVTGNIFDNPELLEVRNDD